MNECLPTSKWERFNLVPMCTAKSRVRMALKHRSGSGRATARLPPRQMSAFDFPSIMDCMAASAS